MKYQSTKTFFICFCWLIIGALTGFSALPLVGLVEAIYQINHPATTQRWFILFAYGMSNIVGGVTHYCFINELH